MISIGAIVPNFAFYGIMTPVGGDDIWNFSTEVWNTSTEIWNIPF